MGKIIVIGEAILDIHTFGKIERINPEAPVPVLHVVENKDKYSLGGASNVANNIASLKYEVIFLSDVGDDEFGKKIISKCEKNNIKTFFIDDGRPTIAKQRFVADAYNQQVLRVDYEQIHDISDEYSDKLIDFIIKENPEILLISDYAKGLITKYFMDNIKSKFSGKIIVDPKPKNINNYTDVFLIKPNVIEAGKILNYKITMDNLQESVKKLSQKFNSHVLLTLGKDGVAFYNKDNSDFHYIESYAKEIFDVSGCGDTFIATFCYGLLNNMSFKESMNIANKAASIVISKFGAVSVSYAELFDS